jgi:hypothetical protein
MALSQCAARPKADDGESHIGKRRRATRSLAFAQIRFWAKAAV